MSCAAIEYLYPHTKGNPKLQHLYRKYTLKATLYQRGQAFDYVWADIRWPAEAHPIPYLYETRRPRSLVVDLAYELGLSSYLPLYPRCIRWLTTTAASLRSSILCSRPSSGQRGQSTAR